MVVKRSILKNGVKMTQQSGDKRNLYLILFMVFLVVVVLSSPVFAPDYNNINPDDETKYIESGRLLLLGQFRDISWGPLLAFLYAPLYLVTKSSPHWSFWSLALGRVILFGLLWLGVFNLALRLSKLVHLWIFVGLMLITMASVHILQNPSDALFAALSAFALERFIAFWETKQTKYIAFTSLFLGLATLTRNDGIPAFVIFLAIALISGLRWKVRVRSLVGSIILPFVLVVGTYYLLHGLRSNNYGVGTLSRTYFAFEQGQWVVSGSGWNTAVQETRQLFGTPQENNHNVLIAIARNPLAFAIRIKSMLRLIPQLVLRGYGHRTFGVLLVLSLVGLVGLIRQKRYFLALLLILWPAYLLSYFFTFFREGYLLLPYSVVIVAAAFGIDYLFCKQRDWKGKVLWILGLLVSSIFFAVIGFIWGLVSVAFLCGGILIEWLLERYAGNSVNTTALSLMVVLGLGLMIKEPYPFPSFSHISQRSQVRAIVFLEGNLPPDSNLLTATPLPAVAARMMNIRPESIPGTVRSPEELYNWLRDHKVEAIFVDSLLKSDEVLWDLISNSIGT